MEEILESLLTRAILLKVSDIHIKIQSNEIKVSFRNESGLNEYDIKLSKEFISYLLYKAKLDISLKAKPQTGVFKFYHEYRKYSIRVAMIQSFEYLSIVLRVLNQYKFSCLADLTNNESDIKKLQNFSKLDYGLLVFSGPTGSGKTTSCYTLLNHIKGKAIYSIEDPIEVNFESFVQLQVNELASLSFSQAIKQILRHDPDVIFIGEVRDEYTAKMAVRCALSGHLVIATIHSGNALATIKRLVEFGIVKADLKEVLVGIVNQRLRYNKYKKRFYASYEILKKGEIF